MSIVTLGEALVDFVSMGELDGAEQFKKLAGGAPFNVACGVAKLGVASAFIGKVSDDVFGRFLLRVAGEGGVNTAGMLCSPEAKTGLAFVSLDRKGERSFCFYRRECADMLLRADELPMTLLESASVFHHGSISLMQSPSREATLKAVECARAAGALISFDPNVRADLWPSPETMKTAMVDCLPLVDILKLSEDEVELVADEPRSLLDRGPRIVVVTHGARGATLYARSLPASVHVAVPPGRNEVVDTTGAGDAFVAGMLSRLCGSGGITRARLDNDGDLLVDSVRWGVAAGTLCCSGNGAIAPQPNREELLACVQSMQRETA